MSDKSQSWPDEYALSRPQPDARASAGLPRGELPPPVSELRDLPTAHGRSRRGDFLALLGCNAIVFGTSVCLMVIELTASRLIAGYLGQSLYTWTSVIGVVLAGISAGNYLGGWLADRGDPRKLLGWLFLLAGLLTFSVLFLNTLVARWPRPEQMHWHWWVMLVVAAVFLLPAVSLGTISPVVASMALRRSARTGVTVGNIYAWGAMGSIVGTFLAGFWLIGEFGTRQIVWMTASALLIMGALVAGSQRAFRVGMLLGVLQFVVVIGVCSSTTAQQMGEVCQWAGGWRSLWSTAPEDFAADAERLEQATARQDHAAAEQLRDRHRWRLKRRNAELEWETWGRKLGGQLHELGLTLALRSDQPKEYNDESDYYAVNVSEGRVDGDLVKLLRLDFLLHSYYNPVNPTKLYYDYEKVYAAVTQRAAERWPRETSVEVPQIPLVASLADALPEGVRYDAAAGRLSLSGGMSFEQLRGLLTIGPSAEFRQAVLSIWEQADRDWRRASQPGGGYVIAALDELPPGVSVPERLAGKLQYDAVLKSLICTAPFSLEDAFDVLIQGDDAPYVRAVRELHHESRRTSAMFIGGGGFVFPRWIESRFPRSPRIDVAEIDPAVKLAVEKQMGLPETSTPIAEDELGPPSEGKTWIRTTIGDARKFVDDRVRENERLKRAGEPPVHYDFIYGDAFNDLSVPWHLTTLEFSRQVQALLTPGRGVYLVNIIDIFPRAQSPRKGLAVELAVVDVEGDVPKALLPSHVPEGEYVPVAGAFPGLEISRPDAGGFRLRLTGTLSDAQRDALIDLDKASGSRFETGYSTAIRELHQRCREQKLLSGPVPAGLRPESPLAWTWVPAGGEFGRLEVFEWGDDGYLLGWRGVMDDGQRDRLLAAVAGQEAWENAIRELHLAAQRERVGQFLGRYVNTALQAFDHVYVFTSNEGDVGDDRDTFVVACSLGPLDLSDLRSAGGHWGTGPFAVCERSPDGERPLVLSRQMPAVLELARGQLLTDDFAPVDNLLAPVFVSRSGDDD